MRYSTFKHNKNKYRMTYLYIRYQVIHTLYMTLSNICRLRASISNTIMNLCHNL